LYIEPDQLRFLYPWTIEGNFCAQAFIFTRNVSSGKIDLMHRVKVHHFLLSSFQRHVLTHSAPVFAPDSLLTAGKMSASTATARALL
jgi:hypothetical protein